jgi:hypothetical protein
MRRKLIKQDAFEAITNSSASNAERELREAEEILAKALNKDYLKLRCFNESTVMFETLDGTYVHAGYKINNNQVTLNGIEELIIDEETKVVKMKGTISEMIDALLNDNPAKATNHLKSYLEMFSWKEGKKQAVNKEISEKRIHNENVEQAIRKEVAKGNEIAEAYFTAKNVLEYAKFVRLGPSLDETVSKSDDTGNITDLRVPTSRLRNEGKLLSFNWKTLNHKVKVLRDGAAGLAESQNFCRAMADLKRHNAVSDSHSLEECLENIVQQWPNVLYVTQPELAVIIGESLRTSGSKNFDDQTCGFMAEGILRKAHNAYSEKVQHIMHLASAPKLEDKSDPYLYFQTVAEQFYPAIDERFGLERKVFADLYESLEKIYKKADRRGDSSLRNETASYLNELANVLNNKVKPDLDLAVEAANWTKSIIETNLESGVWTVSNKAHQTVSGDHPDMAKKAAYSYKPSSDFSGNWGDSAPMISQDDMSYKGKAADQARSNSWGNVGGKDTFPTLNNPYIPKPFGDYTLKGEKGVDQDTFGQHNATWQSNDTWPNLQNPYCPKEAGGEGGSGYKMKTDNLVVDK